MCQLATISDTVTSSLVVTERLSWRRVMTDVNSCTLSAVKQRVLQQLCAGRSLTGIQMKALLHVITSQHLSQSYSRPACAPDVKSGIYIALLT